LIQNKKLLLAISHIWSKTFIKLVELICGLHVEISGLEHLKEPVIIASKHQSILEPIILYSLLKEAKFVLKDSLFFVPVLGLSWKLLDMIFIDRKSSIKAMRKIKNAGEKIIGEKKSIVIFPEGTRTLYGEKTNIRPGIWTLYELGACHVLPVGLNIGKFWPKHTIAKKPGICKVVISPPIKPGLEKNEFITLLQKKIDDNSL
jgi:1-acyl-sn-glycerol-3-phosphate acyltransferase